MKNVCNATSQKVARLPKAEARVFFDPVGFLYLRENSLSPFLKNKFRPIKARSLVKIGVLAASAETGKSRCIVRVLALINNIDMQTTSNPPPPGCAGSPPALRRYKQCKQAGCVWGGGGGAPPPPPPPQILFFGGVFFNTQPS